MNRCIHQHGMRKEEVTTQIISSSLDTSRSSSKVPAPKCLSLKTFHHLQTTTDSDCVCVLSSMWPPEEQREKPGTFQNYSSFWHVTRILQVIGSLAFDHSTLPAHIPLDVPLAPTPNPLHAAKSKLVSSHSSWKTSPWPMRSNMAYSRLGFSRMICQNPSM